jgi:hypothetical protein
MRPDFRGLPIASFHCRVGFAPALCLTAALLGGTAKCPESLCPMSVLPPTGETCTRRLLRGHYSSVIAPTDSFANPLWLFFPSALASCKKSSQVASSPCCHRSGRTMARTRLRMMLTFPSSPLSFRTVGFPQSGWKAGISDGAFPSTTSSSRRAVCNPPFVHLAACNVVSPI